MTGIVIAHILTLVLAQCSSLSSAAPTHRLEKEQGHEPQEKTKGTLGDYNLILKNPAQPLPAETKEPYHFPFRQSLTPRLLLGYTTDLDHPFTYGVGVVYQWPRYTSPHAELGADLIPDYGGQIHFGVKHVFLQRNYYRPFVIWGMTHEVVAKDKLATFTNIDNYYLRGSLGFEDVLKIPKSVRLEAELLVGIEKIILFGVVGFSWAW